MADNPPAFPSVCLNDPGHPNSAPGMTLRDYFAGQALNGWLASWPNSGPIAKTPDGEKALAESAYRFADAMLAAREKQP